MYGKKLETGGCRFCGPICQQPETYFCIAREDEAIGSIGGLHRIFALPFEWNRASMRVLEKVGFELEGRMRRSTFKDGKLIDQFLYAFIKNNRLNPLDSQM